MTNTSTPPSMQDVYDALAELKKGRSRSRANIAIKGILYRYGDGVRHLHDLDPKYYAAVIAAVTIPATPTPADFYGTVTDNTELSPTEENSSVKSAAPPTASTRTRAPMTMQLEALLAARVGMPRSKPGGRVDIGAPAQPGDEDTPRQYSSDGRKMS